MKRVMMVLVLVALMIVVVAPVQAAGLRQTSVVQLTPDLISMLLGVLISLAASYLPGFRVWWGERDADFKMAASGLASVAIGVGVYLLACYAALPFVACPTGGFWTLFGVIVMTLIANQATDRVSPDTADVKYAKRLKAWRNQPAAEVGSTPARV